MPINLMVKENDAMGFSGFIGLMVNGLSETLQLDHASLFSVTWIETGR
jgi:hypothetical protein